jgi:hypothetical protein
MLGERTRLRVQSAAPSQPTRPARAKRHFSPDGHSLAGPSPHQAHQPYGPYSSLGNWPSISSANRSISGGATNFPLCGPLPLCTTIPRCCRIRRRFFAAQSGRPTHLKLNTQSLSRSRLGGRDAEGPGPQTPDCAPVRHTFGFRHSGFGFGCGSAALRLRVKNSSKEKKKKKKKKGSVQKKRGQSLGKVEKGWKRWKRGQKGVSP